MGNLYDVVTAFVSDDTSFAPGERLRFLGEGFDLYDGCDFYVFEVPASGRWKTIVRRDGEATEQWAVHLRRVAHPAPTR